jgi:type IX secretion system PorP/SprF family membrane protein
MKAVVYCGLFFLAMSKELEAQDPAFSQFFASPLTLNPALTGKFNGIIRAAGNYRNQWPSVNNAFITSTVSIDGSILKDKLPESDAWGIGIMAMSDKTASGILTSNFVSIYTAYHKSINEDGTQQIGVGFQGTYANKILDGPRLNFADGLQIDGSFLPSPTEPVNQKRISANYFDMNAGVLYKCFLQRKDNICWSSVYHINQPRESFLGMETSSCLPG